jgi:hypothetical protein
MARTSSAPSHLYSRCLLHNPTEKTDGEKRVEEEERRRCDADMEVRERGGARSRDRSAAHPFLCQKGRAIGPTHMLAHPPFSSIKKLDLPSMTKKKRRVGVITTTKAATQ